MIQTLESVIQEAEALQKAKRPAEAIALYESALTRWPDQPGLLYNLGNAQMQLGQTGMAIGRVEHLPELVRRRQRQHGGVQVAKLHLGAAEGEELLPFLQRRPDLFRLVGRGDACTVALRGVAATWP